MFFSRVKNLLPKGFADGVALKTHFLNIKLLRLRGNRKLLYIVLIAFLAIYFAPYQVTLAIPPIKQSIASAATEQEQRISALQLAHPFQLPHPGYLTTGFSGWHPGIDIATGLGMPIRPVAPGKVVEVVYGFFGLGHYVVVEHDQGFRSIYGHMGKIYVKNGDAVNSGSSLGEVGLTGRTSGPHTHLELTRNESYIDPRTFLPKVPDWPEYAGKAPQGQGEEKKEVKPEEPTKPTKLNLLDLGKIDAKTPPSSAKGLRLNYLAF